jgi:hypothetical protein
MLVIRSEQVTALEQSAVQGFVEQTLDHVRPHFPNHWRVVGEERLAEVIRLGVERADEYGLTSRRDVTLYINLMLLLGSRFDRDPQLPWAAATLTDPAISDPQARIDRTYDAAMDHLDRTAGEDNEHLEQAIARIRSRLDKAPPRVPDGQFRRALLGALHWAWPEKYQAVGDARMEHLAAAGTARAGRYGIAGQPGLVLFVGLMFMLGAFFDTDPQFAWAAETLTDPGLADEAARVSRLRTRAVETLEAWQTETA